MATRTDAARKTAGKKRSFHQELVLNRWILRFFNVESLGGLKQRLGDDRFEGVDEDGQTRFFHELSRGLFDPTAYLKKIVCGTGVIGIAGLTGTLVTNRILQSDRPQTVVALTARANAGQVPPG